MQWSQPENEYINLGEVENIPHIELFEVVSEVIADDTLDYVNRNSRKVTPKNTIYSKYGKRMLDIVLSIIALIITAPINLILAICTYFDVGRPIIFRQNRSGKNGNVFRIVKFRNMTNDTDENGNLLPPSQRVTKFGRFVRKASLDELLNFWSILKGDMSIIGPRPLPLEYERFYSDRHRARNFVRPGLECPILSHIENGDAWLDRFEQEVYYVEHVSLALDIKMIFALVKMALNPKSSNIRGTATGGSFMGYNRDGSCINSQKVKIEYFNEALKRMDISDEKITTNAPI